MARKIDHQAKAMGFDDGFFGRELMTRLAYAGGRITTHSTKGYKDYMAGHELGGAYRRLGLRPSRGGVDLNCTHDGVRFVITTPTSIVLGRGTSFQEAKDHAFMTLYSEHGITSAMYDINEDEASANARIGFPQDAADRYLANNIRR